MGPNVARLKTPVRTSLLVLFALLAAGTAGASPLPFARENGGGRLPAMRLIRDLDRPSLHDVYVVPTRPGQNRVRWYGFDFKEVMLPQLPGAGVKLFYYESEEPVAAVAAAVIRDEYLELARAFDYVPERVVPYILYGTQVEFQTTNTFAISEGVLGVTSPVDLTLALPFFGDLEQFRHTSTHELAHEFTIQMIKSYAEKHERPTGLGGFPLWFIEGLAEYAAYGGLDPEAQPTFEVREGVSGPALPGLDPEGEAWARDLVYHADPFEGFMIVSFYSDVPQGYVHTYKLGQVRLAFLGSTFGRDMLLWLLRNSHYMGLATEVGDGITFPKLVEIATGYDAPTIERMFREWLRQRYLSAYEGMRTRVPAVTIVDDLPVEPEAVIASPDGKTLMIRGFERELGEASLWLVDAENTKRYQHVVTDSRPGLESLHVLSRRTFALGASHVAWIGRSGRSDILHVAPLTRLASESGDMFDIGDERTYDLSDAGLIEAGDPTFSPDGKRIAFAGIGEGGFADVWIMPLDGGVPALRRLTRSVFSEADLVWTEQGIYLSCDATEDGLSNVFLMDPGTGSMEPVVTGASRMSTPVPSKGGLLFASDRDDRWDLHRVEDGQAYRITDVTTMIRWPAPGPDGDVYGILIHGGHFQLVRVPPIEQLRLEPEVALARETVTPAREMPRLALPSTPPDYEPFDHFGLDAGAIAVGTQSVAFGGITFSDLLRDRLVAVQLAVYGALEFTDASVFYLDRSARTSWLGGVFHTFQPKRDRTLEAVSGGVSSRADPEFYLEREFGTTFALVHPTSRFERFTTALTLEGVSRSRFTGGSVQESLWNRVAGGSEPQILLSLGYGLDTLRYHPLAGPISGGSLDVEVGGAVLPQRVGDDELEGGNAVHGWAEGDAQRFLYLGGRSVIWTRAAAGAGFGSVFSRQFYLSSVDNLRGYRFGDPRLLGTLYYVANAELSVPLDWLVRLALFEGLRGVAGADFGGASDAVDELWDQRSLAFVLGVDFLAGPLALRLHFGLPVQIGPTLPEDGWVTNLALRLRY